jgi:hypothetical protein
MNDVDLEEIFETIMKAQPSFISQAVDMLSELWLQDDFEAVEIFAEEILTDETPKEFLTQILGKRGEMPDFVENFVAAIDGKRIVDLNDFDVLINLENTPRSPDIDEFNASRSGRSSASLNRDCPEKQLAILARDERWEVRYRVALNPSATSEILESILTGSYPESLEFLSDYLEVTIALHKNSSDKLLTKLASSESAIVRTAVACNPITSTSVKETAISKGVDPNLLNFPRFGRSASGFRESQLCWWFGDLSWTFANLPNLTIGLEPSSLLDR